MKDSYQLVSCTQVVREADESVKPRALALGTCVINWRAREAGDRYGPLRSRGSTRGNRSIIANTFKSVARSAGYVIPIRLVSWGSALLHARLYAGHPLRGLGHV
jgi:hypothetical protein